MVRSGSSDATDHVHDANDHTIHSVRPMRSASVAIRLVSLPTLELGSEAAASTCNDTRPTIHRRDTAMAVVGP